MAIKTIYQGPNGAVGIDTQQNVTVSANYTLQPSDYIVTATGAGSFTITLQPAGPSNGKSVLIKCLTTASITINAYAGEFIDTFPSKTLVNGEVLDIVSDGTKWVDTVGTSISGSKIIDGTILNSKLSSNAVTEAKIASSAVTEAKIASSAVTEAKIASSAVTEAKIASSAVTEAKIANGQITDVKMAAGVQQRLANSFMKKQIVNRRPIITEATGPSAWISVSLYGPFGYNVPSVQAGAERRFRIYAVYSDNITSSLGRGYPSLVSFKLSSNNINYGWYGYYWSSIKYGDYDFYLPYTWGDAATYRDAFSNEIVGNLDGGHATVNIGPFDDGSGRSIKVLYMEIQTLDVFP